MKIATITSMNRRHEISRLYAAGMDRFMSANPDHTYLHFAAVSEAESEKICEEHCIIYTTVPNVTVGQKFNAVMELAMSYEWDYLCIMGDDDIIDPEAWRFIDPLLNESNPYFGFDRIYFRDHATGRSIYYVGTLPHVKVIGCGRFTRRDMVQAIYPCWFDHQDIGMDRVYTDKLERLGVFPTLIPEMCMVDIKTDLNIWKWSQYKKDSPAATQEQERYVDALIRGTKGENMHL